MPLLPRPVPVSLPFLLSFSHSCLCCYCSFSFIFLFFSFSFVLLLLLHLSLPINFLFCFAFPVLCSASPFRVSSPSLSLSVRSFQSAIPSLFETLFSQSLSGHYSPAFISGHFGRLPLHHPLHHRCFSRAFHCSTSVQPTPSSASVSPVFFRRHHCSCRWLSSPRCYPAVLDVVRPLRPLLGRWYVATAVRSPSRLRHHSDRLARLAVSFRSVVFFQPSLSAFWPIVSRRLFLAALCCSVRLSVSNHIFPVLRSFFRPSIRPFPTIKLFFNGLCRFAYLSLSTLSDCLRSSRPSSPVISVVVRHERPCLSGYPVVVPLVFSPAIVVVYLYHSGCRYDCFFFFRYHGHFQHIVVAISCTLLIRFPTHHKFDFSHIIVTIIAHFVVAISATY